MNPQSLTGETLSKRVLKCVSYQIIESSSHMVTNVNLRVRFSRFGKKKNIKSYLATHHTLVPLNKQTKYLNMIYTYVTYHMHSIYIALVLFFTNISLYNIYIYIIIHIYGINTRGICSTHGKFSSQPLGW